MKLNFDFLKDSVGIYNFGRVVPAALFFTNIVALAIIAIATSAFDAELSCWHTVIYCSGFITGCIIYFIEIFCRERVKLKVTAGNKEFGIESEGIK